MMDNLEFSEEKLAIADALIAGWESIVYKPIVDAIILNVAKCDSDNLHIMEEYSYGWGQDKIQKIVSEIHKCRVENKSKRLVFEVGTGEPPYPYRTNFVVEVITDGVDVEEIFFPL